MPVSTSAPATTAVEFAIGLVAARSWPEKKLREKIRARYSPDETDAAIERLRELRMVDDAAWAERFARDRFERFGRGRHRIRVDLVAKGIDAAVIDLALASVFSGDVEREKAMRLLETLRRQLSAGAAKKLDEPPSPPPTGQATHSAARTKRRPSAAESLKNRLFRRMLARGYPASLVRDLLDVS